MTIRYGTHVLLALATLVGCGRAQYTVHQADQTIEARFGAQACYDSVRGRLLVYGGEMYGGAPTTTWEFDGANWSQSAAPSPGARDYGAMAPSRSDKGECVVFGGLDANGTPIGTTLIWDPLTQVFTSVSPATSPPARSANAMAYDANRRRTVMYGGKSATGTGLSDLWEWNGTTWTAANATGLSPRLGHSMAFDAARGQTVIFGGEVNGIPVNETLVWDGTRMTTVATTGPTPRGNAAMAYDEVRQRIVLFGGSAPGPRIPTYYADTWEWDGSSWSQRNPAHSPPVLTLHNMVWNPQRQRMQLFGGRSLVDRGFFAEYPASSAVWEWDGQDWTFLPTTGLPAPLAKGSPFAAYDASTGKLVMLFNGETWLYDGVTPERRYPVTVPVPQACAFYGALNMVCVLDGNCVLWGYDGVDWIQVHSAVGAPSPRTGPSVIYDSVRSRLVLFGGLSGAGWLADTWEYDAQGWHQRTPGLSPGPRAGAPMVFDAVRGHTVLCGGLAANNTETWTWNGAVWAKFTTANVPGAKGAMLYDTVRNKAILVAGTGNGGPTSTVTFEWIGTAWSSVDTHGTNPGLTVGVGGEMYGTLMWHDGIQRGFAVTSFGQAGLNTAEWDSFAGLWGPRNWTVPGREDHAAAFDRARGKMVVFGGRCEGSSRNETFEWDGRSWSIPHPTFSPSPRYAGAMGFNAATGLTTLFGGLTQIGPSGETYTYDGSTWRPAFKQTGLARINHAMCASPGGSLVMFGGSNGGLILSDLLTLETSGWVTQSTSGGPAARQAHAMAYDRMRGRAVLFGGLSSTGVPLGDTWELLGAGSTYVWTPKSPTSSPPARVGPEMTYDESRGCVVMTGGYLGNGTVLNDIWEWNGSDWRERRPETVPAPAAYNHTLVYDNVHARCVHFGGTDGTKTLGSLHEIFAPIDLAGKGHVTKALPLVAYSPAALGRTLRLWFDNPMNIGGLNIGIGPNSAPVFVFPPPHFCTTATFWLSPLVTLSVGGMPKDGIPLAIPLSPSLSAGTLTFQGVALQPAGCALATDALNVRIIQP